MPWLPGRHNEDNRHWVGELSHKNMGHRTTDEIIDLTRVWKYVPSINWHRLNRNGVWRGRFCIFTSEWNETLSFDYQLQLANSLPVEIRQACSFIWTINSTEVKIDDVLYFPGLTSPMFLGMDVIRSTNLVRIEHQIQEDNPSHGRHYHQLNWPRKFHLENFYVVRLKKATPIKQRYYPGNPAMQSIINTEVHKMLTDNVIKPLNSPWSSPVILVKKRKVSILSQFSFIKCRDWKGRIPTSSYRFEIE